ncbi:MAG TPA: LPS-assembly protein LptD [Thiobacillaceae bacterium]|nr:LPS-assembly protein LptD [Thiobacillaceae bacterium]HNU64686.1 LPS-assembly protein LptD [Thiobacillaceae bacterium]
MPPAPHPKPPFARLLLYGCLAAACQAVFAADPEVQLKTSQRLSPRVSPAQTLEGPTFLEADEVRGHVGRELEASGQVVIHNLRERVEADWLRYDQDTDEVRAKGDVVFVHEQYRVQGQELTLKLTQRLGSMTGVHFELHDRHGQSGGREKVAWVGADVLHFQGPDHYQMDAATYTTCVPGQPDWILKTEQLKLDYATNLGMARNVRVEFMDTPILYAPWMDFSLDDRRKSGFLAPSYGASSERGLELVVPWYWNIAPNRDATIIPRMMTQRGVQLGGEFRYLERAYRGDLGVEFLPNDRVARRTRYLGVWHHQHQLNRNWSAGLDLEGVSDDRYFVDLSNQVSQTSQVNLPRQAMLNYDAGWLKGRGLLQAFQTLQDPAAPIFEPYRRLPQLTMTASRERLGQLVLPWNVGAEFVHFDRADNRGAQGGVQGRRLHVNPSVSAPIQTSFATLTPKLGWYFTRYDLDDATLLLRDTRDPARVPLPPAGFASTTRSMPVFSLDSSLMLERDGRILGQDYIQTLEPRLYYLYIPYRAQDRIPVFDTGVGDLSMDQLFGENQFIGVDRINDANQITLGLTSRFLDQKNGRERLAVTLGQRYFIHDQRVTFPGQTARSAKSTDLLALVSGQLNDRLRIGAGVQFNTEDGVLAKANLGGSWREGPGRVINADYRYANQRYAAPLNQIDLSAQWPLAPGWYGLGRLNYSMQDSRLVEGLAGVEYNAGCWSLRGVVQRLATAEHTVSNALFLQLELRGLTKLGPNPLDILKRSISGYAKSDELDLP